VDPVFAMKFLYSLSYESQDFLSFQNREVRIFLVQGKESVFEIGIDKNAFLFVAIDVHSKPTGAGKLGSEAE